MIRNQFIHQVPWTPMYEAMVDFGRSHINEARVSSIAKSFRDSHVIIFRCSGKDTPQFQLAFKEEIEFIQVFAILPKSIGGIHKDGLNRQCAFNIPLLNCDEGFMEWYDDSLPFWTHDSLYTKVRVAVKTQNAIPVFSTLVDQPSLVNTNVWHRMNNACGEKTRYMLSVRFTSNKPFDEMSNLIL